VAGGGFYLGSYFLQEFETENQSDYQLSQGGDFEHLRETGNVEELWINPEDMDIPPEEIQVGPVQWVTFSPSEFGFYVSPQGPVGFYLGSLGPVGFYMQSIGI